MSGGSALLAALARRRSPGGLLILRHCRTLTLARKQPMLQIPDPSARLLQLPTQGLFAQLCLFGLTLQLPTLLGLQFRDALGRALMQPLPMLRLPHQVDVFLAR